MTKAAVKRTVSEMEPVDAIAKIKGSSTMGDLQKLIKDLEETSNLKVRRDRAETKKAKQSEIIEELKKKRSELLTVNDKRKAPKVGMIMMDDEAGNESYGHEGDVINDATFKFQTIKVVCKGLTNKVARDAVKRAKVGKHITVQDHIKAELERCVKELESKGVVGITADTGILQYYQECVCGMTNLPVYLSSLLQCTALASAYQSDEKILVLTADSHTLDKDTLNLILTECHIKEEAFERFEILGCQDITGIQDLIQGKDFCEPIISKELTDLTLAKINEFKNDKDKPNVKAILLENTEMCSFADVLREKAEMPVFDLVNLINLFHSATRNNPNF